MSSREILDLLKLLLALPFRSFWSGVAALFDRLRGLDSFWAGLMVAAVLAIPVVLAFRLQKSLIRTLMANPGTSLGFLPFLKMELWHSVFALPLWPFQAVRLAFRALVRGGRALVLRRKAKAKDASAPAAAPAPQASQPSPPSPPVVIATLGPGFLLAGLVTAVFYGAARAAEPLLRSSLELSPGLSAWQYLFLGRRPELEWYLPLDRFPFLAGLLTVLLWLAVWSFVGICVRLAYRAQLGRNLADARHDETVLPAWRRWSGVPFLVAPVQSYREWAGWLLVGAVPLLLWAWLSLAGDPYRLRPSELAVALVLWTSWSLHLKLRGEERLPLQADAEEPSPARANGWPEVLAHLERELRIGEPEPFEMRPAEPLPLSEVDPRTAGILSPLLAELLPPPRKLTPMQRTVLTRLALQGFVHVEPPVALDQLQLGDSVLDVLEDRSGQRSRNLIVLAPEGAGKTTLALLAAANHALVHTRASLIVVRSEEAAARLAERFRRAIEPSTLRWNVRVRLLGTDLMTDLAQGIAPDVVVCSLHGLTTTLLDRSETFSPFLRNLGLVLIDDVEAFLGPVEVHAQLAFRRLSLRVAELSGARELGEKARESAAQVLVAGTDSMHRMPEWVRHLCGIDAVARTFSHSAQEAGERDAAALAATGNAPARLEKGEDAPAAGSGEAMALGRHHRFYRLRDFLSAAGELLTFAELIGVCERLAVPWHYRLCGDGGRTLGRGPLLLREEPEHCTESPEEACVLLLEGSWSEVRRERRRLARAGSRFRRARGEGSEREEEAAAPEPIAFVTRVDSDEEMALTQLDKRFSLAPEIDVLPRPVLRPPTGLAVDPHLGADLVQHWLEVEDVVRVFGGSVARKLQALAAGGLLLCERRTDVDERASEHVEHVHVRALARAVRAAGESDGEDDLPGLLPPKVTQVELTARHSVAVRDRTGLSELGRVDAASAHLSYYPGRIFQDARGVFVVVGRAAEEMDEGHLAGDVLVEPLLSDEISSPRRTFRVRTLDGSEGTRELLENAGGAFPEPGLVLIGQHPFRLALEPIEVAADHIATYRLGILHSEIRQRTLLDRSARERYRALAFPTVGLTLFPNPDRGLAESPDADEGPKLTLEGARLLAAALRNLLPSIVRGAALDLRVAVRLDCPEGTPADHVLGPAEGLTLFDTEAGGNGAARAIHRDGVELLLRLSRLLIERVLSYDRLRALQDEWGSEAEILAESRNDPAELSDGSEAGSERDARARREALIWLDSRLRPEGGVESWQGAGLQGSGSEQGEGDFIDLGRCWYSRDGAVTDLLWAKHRWRQPSGREALLDLAFDRTTAAEARRLPGNARLLATYAADHAARLEEDPGRRAPREVWFLPAGEEEPQRSMEGEPAEPLRALHSLLTASASHSGAALSQLAAALRDRCTAQDRSGLASYLAAFVQGIPFSIGGELRPPVSTLLYRLGDAQAKGVLLATLLDLCGIGSGLFVSLEEGHTVVAAALPDSLPAGDANARARHLAEWSTAAGLAELPRLWGEVPEGEGNVQLYVPIEATAYCPVGLTVAENPRNWAFLPLTLLERRLDLDRLGPASTDRAEHESRF